MKTSQGDLIDLRIGDVLKIKEALKPTSFDRAKSIYRHYGKHLKKAKKEIVAIIMLNSRLLPIHDAVVSIGSLTTAPIHPREVFIPAIRASAAAIILIHNHPSGNPHPSKKDIEITQTLDQAGLIIGITLLDHIIFGHTGYFSFVDERLLSH